MKDNNYKYRILVKIFLFTYFIAFGSLSAQIWTNPLTTVRPIANYYLGDKLSSPWYYNYEIGQASWNASEAGIGQNADGTTGWNWANANYYADGSGSNKRVRRDFGNFQFTQTGTWYITGRAKANAGDAWTYSDEGGWSNDTSLNASTSSGNCAYFTVNALNTPVSATATAVSGSQIDLGWSKDAQNHNVMIVRSTTNTFTAPTQGTAYSVGATIGSGTVIYNSNGTAFSDTGLTCNTTYYYAFYSENYSYYSTAVTANALTLSSVPSITTQPSSASSCTTGTATFTAAASGSGLSYQWQEFTSAWNAISNGGVYSGANTNSLTITNPTSGMNGYKYRAVVTGTCSATSTNTDGNATLTVNASAAISAQPSVASATYCAGSAITPLSVTASGSNIGYQWYSNTTASNSGGTLISGATSSSYTPDNSVFSKKYYYVVVSNTCNSVTSNVSGLVTVVPSVSWANIKSAPQSLCNGTNATISGEIWVNNVTNNASNAGYFEAQYAYNTANTDPATWDAGSWTAIATAPTSANNNLVYTASFGSALSANTYYYSIRYRTTVCGNWVYGGYNGGQGLGGFWGGANVNGTLTINANTSITTQPSATAQNLCQNAGATALTVAATGLGLSYQWYSNSSAANSGGTLISGANSSSYTPPTNSVGTQYYYVVVSGTCGASVTSNVSGAIVVNSNSSAALSSAVGTNNQTVLNDSTPITSITYALVNISAANVTGLPTGVTGSLAGNTYTISGAPTQVGTFNYSISFTANCGTVANLTGTIQVNSYLVEYANIQSPKKPQTILLGEQFDVYAQVKITGITDAPGYGSGASGWLGYSLTNTNPNTWTNWTVISYNPNYDTSPSYQIANDEYYYIDFVNNENLEGGTYYYASRFQRNGSSEYTYGGTDEVDTNFSGGIWGTTNANGKVNVSGIVKVVDEVIWDGTQWKWFDDDEGTSGAWKTIAEPNQKLKAKIEGNYPASAPSFTCKKLTVDSGISVTIGAGKFIRVMNEIVNNNASASQFTVESDGSLIQVNDASVNTGNITVKRNANLKRLDYNYWGSPVSGQNIRSFSPGTLASRFYTYNETDDYFYWIDPYANTFEKGKGYAIRASNTAAATPETFVGQFVGAPHNGLVSIPLAYTDADHGYNLIANPYPSNIDFSQFYSMNSDKVNHLAYFWTNVNPNPAMQGSNYPNGGYLNNYAIFNGSGGVPAMTTGTQDMPTPTNFIKVGQGFIIKAKASGTATMNNSVRVEDDFAIFFNRMAQPKEEDTERFWLDLTTPLQVTNRILIAYKRDATDGFELDYDAPHYLISSDCFYSVLNDQKLAIQGRKYPLQENDEIPLGASFYADGNYTISLSKKEGIFLKKAVYLIDELEQKMTNLQEESYTFSAKKGLDDARFKIVYHPDYRILATDDSRDKNIVVYAKEQFFVAEAPSSIKSIKIVDASGKLIMVYQPYKNHFEADATALPLGMYYVEVETAHEKTVKKVLKR